MVWDFDPVMFTLPGREVYWYGFMWFLTMCIGTWIFYVICRREGQSVYKFFGIFLAGYVSPILGARLGHCLFYEWEYYSAHPLAILNFGEGGMASHGAAIGLLVGLLLFSLCARMPYIWSLDRIMLPVAAGGALVRLGNLMNSEIYGHPTTLPWGFTFVRAGETVPMHPTQIYAARWYAGVFCLLLGLYFKKDAGARFPGLMFGAGLTGIFSSRFLVEFIKNPQADFEAGMALNMGQWLSISFIAAGVVFTVLPLVRARRKI
ncbi:MAG: prolipoprotein diacylglyceryl transferase [Alistipes sp.]|nr:prolipoprotein diacylglyceryl transferase [Alistipes sp.]